MEPQPDIETITTLDDPCEGCDGASESNCCGAPIISEDICSECLEHCSNRCEDCEYEPTEI